HALAAAAGPRRRTAALLPGAAVCVVSDSPLLVSLDLNHRPALGTFRELWEAVLPHIGTVDLLVLSCDVLPTLAELTGATCPSVEASESAQGDEGAKT
ncbi:unnamed protein product, partial [Polarella glacialis]